MSEFDTGQLCFSHNCTFLHVHAAQSRWLCGKMETERGENMAYNPYTGRWEMDAAQQVQMQPLPRAQTPQYTPLPPKLGVLTVASEGSIANLQMQPNDNALALHETENLLYYIRTDSMGAKSIARFRIFPEPSEEEKAANQLQEQLKQIADGMAAMSQKIMDLEGKINAEPNYANDERRERKQPVKRPDADGKADPQGAKPTDDFELSGLATGV